MFCGTRKYFSESKKFQQIGINRDDLMSDRLVCSFFRLNEREHCFKSELRYVLIKMEITNEVCTLL